MKVQFIDAMEAVEPLKKVLSTKGLSFRVAFKIAKLVDAITKATAPFFLLRD